MELCSKQIAKSGVEMIVSTTPSGSQTVTVSRSGSESVSFSLNSSSSTTAGDAKRPRLEPLANLKKDFDRKVAALSEWLDQTEGMLELVTSEAMDPQDQLTVEEQMVLLEDADGDIKAHRTQIDELKIIADNLKQELNAVSESLEPVDTAMRRLETRWSGITERVMKSRETVSASNDVAQFCTELEAVRSIIAVYDSWAAAEGRVLSKDFIQLSQQLEQCRVKQKALKSHDLRVNKLNERSVDLLKSGRVPAAVEDSLKQLNERWNNTIKRLNDRHTLLTKALQKTPPKSFMDAFVELTNWTGNREQTFQTIAFNVDDTAIMEQQTSQLKELRTELKDRAGSLDYINHAGQDLLRKTSNASDQSAAKLRTDLQSLNTRWNQLQGAIEDRLKKFTNAVDQLKHLRSQMDGVLNWIKEIEVFLTSEEPALGDLETLQAQLAEAEGVQDDIRTMQPTVDSIVSVCTVLRSHAEPSFSGRLNAEVESMRSRWVAVTALSQQHVNKLTAAIGETRTGFENMSTLETWLDDVTHAHLSREYTVHTEAELVQFSNNFQRLEAELKSSRDAELQRVSQSVKSLVGAAGQSRAVELAAALLRLETKFTDVKQQITTNSAKFQTATENLATCRVLIDDEMKWLDETEGKLSRGLLRTSADAEELSEELDDLEHHMSQHNSDEVKLRITSLTQALLNDHVMVALVTSSLDVYTNRLHRIQQDVKQRITQLEEAIIQAQARETQIVEMSQWMSDVNELLQTRLDADVLASDTPKEFESLKAEFAQHDTYMIELEKDIVTFREQGKLDAADRLDNQLALLKKHYAEVMAKFVKFQRPSDFDMKLTHVKHLLEEIEEHLNCLDITSGEPDEIQEQLDQCMKFYKAMSEIKGEVEYVIKTGRQIVEKKQVDIPEQLNSQIDSIKLLYNDLGAQVTQGKTSLEQVLKLAKKLKKESTSLREFVTNTNKELLKREMPTASKDIEDELVWVKTTAGELNKKQPVLAALGDIVGQLTKMSDEGITSAADSNVRQLGDQLNELVEQINNKKTLLQENIERLEQIYVEFETMQREVVIWIDNAEDVLKELDQFNEDNEPKEEDTKKFKMLQSEHDQLISQVDAVRDSAVEIITHSTRYSKTVEPLLTALNQRWQEVTTRLKAKQNFFRESSIKNKNKKQSTSKTPSPPQISVENYDFEASVTKAMNSIESCQKTLSACDLMSSPEVLQQKLKEIDETQGEIGQEVTGIEAGVDEILLDLNKTDTQKADRVCLHLEQLKTRYALLCTDCDRTRLSISRALYPQFVEFIQLSNDITVWLSSMQLRLSENATSNDKNTNLNTEFINKQTDVEKLNHLATEMPTDCAFVHVKVTEILNPINSINSDLQKELNLLTADELDASAAATVPIRGSVVVRHLKVEPVTFIAQPAQYLHDLELVQSMMGIVEEEVEIPLVQDYKFDFANPEDDEIKMIEDAVNNLQQSVESARTQQDSAVSSMSGDECARIAQILKSLDIRLTNLQQHLDERKRSEETLLTSMDAFTTCMEDMSIWLTEAESTADEVVNFADCDQLEKLLDAAKEKEESFVDRRQQLRILSNSGRSLYFAANISADDRNRISHDLTVATQRWNAVVCTIPKKISLLEDKLDTLTNLSNLLDKHDAFIEQAKQQLHQIHEAVSIEPSDNSDDYRQTIIHILVTGQCDVDAMTRIYGIIKSDALNGVVPAVIQQQVDNACAQWNEIRSQAVLLQSSFSRMSAVELPETELIQPVRMGVVCSSVPDTDKLFELQPSTCSELDNRCSEFLQTVELIVARDRSQAVIVGNIADTEQTIKNLQTKRNELEVTCQQLVAECNQFKLERTMSSNDQQILTDRTSQLSRCGEQAKTELNRRIVELEDMLLECRQFDQMMAEFDRWILSIEEDCDDVEKDAVNANTLTTLEPLLSANRNLQTEIAPWQQKVNALKSLADKLINGYCDDNASNIKSTINKLDLRWTSLSLRLATQDKQLQSKIASFRHFDADMKELLMWLTKIEVILMHHEEAAITENNSVDNDKQRQKLQTTFRELQSDIESRRSTVQTLNATGSVIVHGLQSTGENSASLQEQLKNVNDRWNKVNERSAELRTRLEIHTVPTNELLQLLTELVDWLRDVNDDITSKSQLVGDTDSLSKQYELSQGVRDKLEVKRSEVENAVRDGRMCRKDEQETVATVDMTVNARDAALTERLMTDIRNQSETLYRSWLNTSERVRDWQQTITTSKQKVQALESAVNEGSMFISALENEAATWRQLNNSKLSLNLLQTDYSQTKSFQRDMRTVETKVLKFRTTAQNLQRDGVSLSSNILGKLDKLDTRVQMLSSTCAQRIIDLTNALKEYGPCTQHILLQSVEYPWERSLTEPNKVPYYVNHITELTQWDHPEMIEIMHSLSEKNSVKFSAYRTSMKLRLLQKQLKFELLELSRVLEELEKQGMTSYNSRNLVISDVVSCLMLLLTAAVDGNTEHNSESNPVNVSVCADLILNWLLNVYDQARSGQISALSFAVAVILMCKGHLDDKCRAVFRLVSDADGHVTEHRLNLLLRECIQIPRHLGEIAAFGGSNVEPSVRSCFEKAGNREEIEASHFNDWMKMEPQSMVWLPVMHRFGAAETARHQAKCSACKECPIIGFRYRCLKCFHFDMCQNCFFAGRRAKSHKLTHPMQEYCSATTSGEDVRDFTKMFKNKFRTKRYFKKHPRLGYLPVQTDLDGNTLDRKTEVELTECEVAHNVTVGPTVTSDSGSSTPSNASLRVTFRLKPGSTTSRTSSPLGQSNNLSSSIEMHMRLELYASRLAEVERKRRESTPDWEDEHSLIAQYCQSLHGSNSTRSLQSPMQIMMAVDADQKLELETMIRDLEEENRLLQCEYDQLKQAHREQQLQNTATGDYSDITDDVITPQNSGDIEMMAEARLLRQHKGRLEARMRILEEHNEQLDAQLKRLRQLLSNSQQVSAGDAHILTYPHATTPSELSNASSHNSLPRRVPPPSFTSSAAANGRNFSIDERRSNTVADGVRMSSSPEEETVAVFQQTMTSEQMRGTNTTNINDLLQVAGEVGKAVESLVTIMTDDEQHDNVDTSKRTTPSTS